MRIRSAKSAACFFCALDLLLGVLPWLVYGISDNLSYNKYIGSVTAVSDFVPAKNVFIDGEPANIAEGEYEYFTESGDRRQGSFTVFEDSKDKYTVGSDYIIYTHEGRSGDVSEYSAKTAMQENIIYPLIFIIPALITAIFGAAKTDSFSRVRENFRGSFYFSLTAPLLSCAAMVYVLFIWENHAVYFAGIAEFSVKLEAAVLCFALLIAEITVWSVSIRREEKKIGVQQGVST